MRSQSRLVTHAVVVLCVSCGSALLAQPYPTLNAVNLRATIRHDSTSLFFYYRYDLSNGNASKGKVEELSISIFHNPAAQILDTVGLAFDISNGTYEEEQFRRHYADLKGKIDPVSFVHLPTSWETVWGTLAVASISSVSHPISPGERVDSIVLMSRGYPSIRGFSAIPDFDVDLIFPKLSDVRNPDSLMQAIDSVRSMVKYTSHTIGPASQPTFINKLDFLDTLISYKHQALALGWIDNEGVANSLDQKLEAAKKKFAGRDSSAARNILQAFINEVEAQKDKHLSSEAYALLKYNGEYLVDRLGGGHDEEKQKEK